MVSSAFKRIHNLLTNQSRIKALVCLCVCVRIKASIRLCDERYILISVIQKKLTQVVDLQIGFYDLCSNGIVGPSIAFMNKIK